MQDHKLTINPIKRKTVKLKTFTICWHESDADGIFGWGFFESLKSKTEKDRNIAHTHDGKEERIQSEREKERESLKLIDVFLSISLSKDIAKDNSYFSYCQSVRHHLNVDLRLTRRQVVTRSWAHQLLGAAAHGLALQQHFSLYEHSCDIRWAKMKKLLNFT